MYLKTLMESDFILLVYMNRRVSSVKSHDCTFTALHRNIGEREREDGREGEERYKTN